VVRTTYFNNMVFPLVCPSPNRPTDHTAIGRRRLSNALDNMAGWNAVTLLYFIVHVCFSSVVVVSVVAVSASTTTWRLLPRRSFLLSTATATTTKHYHYYPRRKFSLPHHIWRKECTGQFQYYNYTAARCRRMLLDLRCGSDTHKEEEEEEAIINESTIGDDGTKNNKEAIIIAAVNVATATTAVMNVAYDENDDGDASSSEQQEVANTIHTVMIDEEGKESYNNSNSSMEDEEAEDKANVTAQQHQQLLLQQLQLATTNKRTEAKILHDCGKLHDAAVAYSDAVVLLDEIIRLTSLAASTFDDDDDDAVVNNNNTMAIVDRATCKLHEALCLLKDGRPNECLTACTNILVDQQGGDNDSINMQYHSSSSSSSSNTNNILLPAQIRGRAYHRRAKAKLAIYDINGALDDAHSGAFLGDKNAVQLYGKLMRQQQRSSSNDGDGLSKDLSSSILHNLLSSSGTGSSSSSSSIWDNQLIRESLAEVLMGEKEDKMDMNKSQQRRKKRNTHNGGSTSCSSTNDSLVKSIATSLMKHIEDEDTQRTICNIIQSTNSQQVLQYASMAGIPMKMETASKLMSIANGITPKTIHNSLSRIKIGYSIIMTVRQVFKLIDDNKSIIIVIVLLFWLRNAFVEPVIRLTK